MKTNDVILVVKDNAYGFGICYMVHIAKKLNIKKFAVKSISEGIFLRSLYVESEILLLGKTKASELSFIKKYQLIPTINDYDDYLLFKEQNIGCHLGIDTGMNRFGMKSGYLAIINDGIVKGIYSHCYDSNNKQKIKFMEELSKNYLKPLHIGGSIAYKQTTATLRVGKMLYENALYFYGHIVNIKELKEEETVGYDGVYQASRPTKIGVCDIGYADGLHLYFNGRVHIRQGFYSVVGRCCMDHCFILIDDHVKIGDEVEFFGNTIAEDEFIKYNQMTKYEMFLQINHQPLTN
ncbi:MAG: alanine racemase [Anaeroplasmataceae bacterium]|nr:alanine racemase [Anaeroplasmataceae bacterium]